MGNKHSSVVRDLSDKRNRGKANSVNRNNYVPPINKNGSLSSSSEEEIEEEEEEIKIDKLEENKQEKKDEKVEEEIKKNDNNKEKQEIENAIFEAIVVDDKYKNEEKEENKEKEKEEENKEKDEENEKENKEKEKDEENEKEEEEKEEEEDEMMFVKRWLQSQEIKTKDNKRLTTSVPLLDEEIKETCLLCQKQFSLDSTDFYVLEACNHTFCLDCIYEYLQTELKIMEEERKNVKQEAVLFMSQTIIEKEEEEKEQEEKEKEKEEEKDKDKDQLILPPPSPLPLPPRHNKKIVCPLPTCNCPVSANDLRKGLDEFNHMGNSSSQSSSIQLTQSLRLFIEQNPELYILCPNEKCGAPFERLLPSENELQRPVNDDDGRPLNALALEHYHKFRFRCRYCDSIFCTECQRMPYHTGLTCQQFEEFGKVDKRCLVCSKPLALDSLPFARKLEIDFDDDEDDNNNNNDDQKGKEKINQGPLYHIKQFKNHKARPVERRRDKIFFWRKKKFEQELAEWEKWRKQLSEQEQLEREEEEKRKREAEIERERIKREKVERRARLRAEKEGNQALVFVCESEECAKEMEDRCTLKLPCGHVCNGVAGEVECMPCIHPDCRKEGQTADDFCNICWIDALGARPCVMMRDCDHIFHYRCVKEKIEARWPTPIISFAFLDCPLCHVRIENKALHRYLQPFKDLEEHITQLGVERIKLESMMKDKVLKEGVMTPEAYANSTFAYYLCHKCQS